jgi:hypothetical protein
LLDLDGTVDGSLIFDGSLAFDSTANDNAEGSSANLDGTVEQWHIQLV